MKDPQLDDLLRDWSQQEQPDDAALAALLERVLRGLPDPAIEAGLPASEVADQPVLVRRPPHRDTGGSIRAQRLVVALLAGVLSLALLFAAMILHTPHATNRSGPLLTSAGQETQQRLFAELNALFPGQWRWSSEVNGRMHLEVSDDSPPAAAPAEGVIVQLAVVRRSSRGQTWSTLWEATVLSRPGEWIRLPDELAGNNRLTVWTCPLPDGGLLVENELALTSPVVVQLSEPRVYLGANTACLWSGQDRDGEYQLLQSVVRTGGSHAG